MYFNITIVGLIEDDGVITNDGMAEIQYFDEDDKLVKTEPIKEVGTLVIVGYPKTEEKKIC